jgi:hypothetical protein
MYTGVAGATGFQTEFTCAAADVITIVFTSTATADQGLNSIKSVIALSM